ncbi:MAG TPA: hypothetical protein VLS93_14225, partial [Anaeromyxobacteraceae bacterium]|nr:hypothetical protein [Anaeromyxobacteraceae bacterium]
PPTNNALIVRTMGRGSVSGGGLDCRANAGICGMEVPVGGAVTLTASAWAGYTFAGWSGCAPANQATCSVTVDQGTLVVATFTPNEVPISVRVEGGPGAVTGSGFNCQSNTLSCLVNAAPGTVLTLFASGVSGSTFVGWGNCPAPSGNACTLTVSGAASLRAYFTP